MTSQTKQVILEQHQSNDLLNTAIPSPMQRNEHDLSADEIRFPIDERVIAASARAMEEGHTHYVPVPGIDALREAVANYLNEETDSAYQSGNVLVTAGMQESRFLTIQLIGKQFGGVAVPEVAHPGVLKALGTRPLSVTKMAVDERQLPTLDAIQTALAGGSKLIVLESPSRLTGAAYSTDEIASIAAMIKDHDGGVLFDQGLMPWGTDIPSIAAQTDMLDRVAVIGEAFPGLGLASWMIGYIAAPESWIAPMQSQKQIMAICTSTASQYAAIEAGNLFGEIQPDRVAQVASQRNAVVEAAEATGLNVLPGAVANIVAVEMTPEQVSRLSDAGYTVGTGYGTSNVVRMLVSSQTVDALKQLI